MESRASVDALTFDAATFGRLHSVFACDPIGWLARQRERGSLIVGVELVDEAIRLADLPAARARTVVVLGHEQGGTPPQALELLDSAVGDPDGRYWHSLNVAVAGSLVLNRLAGLI